MNLSRLNWQEIVRDLSLHLRSAVTLEQVHRIFDNAERDLARLGKPADFWARVGLEYERIASRLERERSASRTGADLFSAVRTLIAARAPR